MKTLSLIAFSVALAASQAAAESKAAPQSAPTKPAAAKSAPKAAKAEPKEVKKEKPMPTPEQATEKAPASYKARFKTTKGDFVLEVTRAWSPNGADRIYNLVKLGFFTEIAFFRVLDNFVAQGGIHGDPSLAARWRNARFADDASAGQSNVRGTMVFATAGPNTRTTQFFINFKDNGMLDSMGFTPFGKVVLGMDVVDKLYKGYGEGAPQGGGPDQGRVQAEGNAYLKKDFPKLDYITSAALEK
ncbi:MAG: cyclophilin type peptidyl-prolyl cis-trans isomerase [Elusimicrobia bacterium]|nr:MAG: cyclophilin type peptidyl-prolyl cis-trans isomerase [Elusimicrobiota bacterium]